MKRNIFDPQATSFKFEPSAKQRSILASEDWSAAILSGSSSSAILEDPLRPNFIKTLVVAVIGVCVILVVALVNLQIVNGAINQSLADGNRIRSRIVPAPRGVMYDRNNKLIVTNLANFDLIVTPTLLPRNEQDRSKAYQTVASIIGTPADKVAQIAESKGLVDPTSVMVAEKISREQALALDENSRDTPGFVLNATPSRQYLDGGSLSHFLGYIGRVSEEDLKANKDYRPTDYIGKGGIESYYEKVLRGAEGQEQTEVEASGKPVRLLASIDPKPGDNLTLSVDKDFQAKTAEILASGVAAAGASSGVAVAMNPQTGEIIAAANYPSYDNNLFARGISNADYQGLLNNPNRPLYNRITQGIYPIGSTIKPMLSAAALQENVVSPSTTIEDKGEIEVPNVYNPSIVQVFSSWKPEGLGIVNVTRAIEWSSDVFFYTIGGGYQGFRGLGVNRISSYLQKFNFGKKTGIDIPSEAAGYIPTPETKLARQKESWTIGDTYNISIGQGNLLVTPLQLLVATSAVANGGNVIKPHLLKKITSADGKTISETKPEIIAKDFISPQNIEVVKNGMVAVVQTGTACCSLKAEVPVSVAGKTGTAETSTRKADGTAETKPHAWFSAYAPAENPQIAIVVLVEYSGEGASYALPIAKEMLKSYFIK